MHRIFLLAAGHGVFASVVGRLTGVERWLLSFVSCRPSPCADVDCSGLELFAAVINSMPAY